MRFSRLDHTDPGESERICTVMRRAYAVEAELIGAAEFPPLRRTAEDIRTTEAAFFGCVDGGRLLAVAEVEDAAGPAPNIAGFVVDPDAFRRGIGTALLRHVLGGLDGDRVTVSTAAANRPAIALYEKRGFEIVRHWLVGDAIEMVTLAIELPTTPAGTSAR